MAKINLTRIFETSRALATNPGKELQDFISYTAEAFTQIIAGLRNALTFEDNFNCIVLDTTLSHNVIQIINTNNKIPRRIFPSCQSTTNYLTGFGWQSNNNGQTTVIATFNGSPTAAIRISLVILL